MPTSNGARNTEYGCTDTNPDVEEIWIRMLRRVPPWRKLEMVAQMNETVRVLMLSGLRRRHPQATPQELRRRLADLILGPQLARQVYGPREGEDSSKEGHAA